MNNEKETKFDSPGLAMGDPGSKSEMNTERQESGGQLISIWPFDIHLTAVLISVCSRTDFLYSCHNTKTD
jgi:hypothetical protein